MSSEWIIGALALITIGGVLVLSIFHFGFHLKDPRNKAAAKAVVQDRTSATTDISMEKVDGRSLRQRLDEAPSVDDRLSSRPVGSMFEVLDMKWSSLRAVVKGEPSA